MKTYKQRALEACRKIRDRYRNPDDDKYCTASKCTLCSIYSDGFNCIGCPLSDNFGNSGCCDHDTYNDVLESLKLGSYSLGSYYQNTPKCNAAFTKRAKYYDRIIPILEKIPERRFTPSGWRYFKEIENI
jgi:hypothetical protein